jgi:diadenylate cyclase
MSKTKTGALIVMARQSSLDLYAETGDILNSEMSSRIIESIFMKNGPLHDVPSSSKTIEL